MTHTLVAALEAGPAREDGGRRQDGWKEVEGEEGYLWARTFEFRRRLNSHPANP